jgi:maleate cis-trans isomerase
VINPRSPGNVQRGSSYQFYRIVPSDVMEISTGLGLADYAPEAVELCVSHFWECVDALVQEKVDVIILGGVPISASLGRSRVLDLLSATRQKTGIIADAPLEALIGSRWADSINRGIIEYLARGGIEVVGITKRNQSASDAAGMSFEDGLTTALEVGREAALLAPAADAVFVPGAAAMSLHVIPAIEDEFGKPTFTNLSLEVWNNLVRPAIISPVQSWGCLLANRSNPTR